MRHADKSKKRSKNFLCVLTKLEGGVLVRIVYRTKQTNIVKPPNLKLQFLYFIFL